MAKYHPESGNLMVDKIFAKGSNFPESLQEDDVPEDNQLYQLALMAKDAAGMHDSRYNNADELEIALKTAARTGIEPLLIEDHGPGYYGFKPEEIVYILEQRRAGKGDAAMDLVFDAHNTSTKLDLSKPLLPAGQRFRQLTDSRRSENLGQTLEPLTLTRISRDVYPPLAAVMTERLSPVLARISPNQALKVTERLATIQLVADSVRPDIELMVGAVADSQARQIGTFMGSVERAIGAAAAGLQNLVGREVTDSNKQKISGTIRMADSDKAIAKLFAAHDNRQIGAQREYATTGALNGVREVTNIHTERPMASGNVAVKVKPFDAHSRTTHFAASSAPIGSSRGQATFHDSTDTGAYASATGPAVCASSATVVEANFHSEGLEVEINVRP